MCQNEKNSSNVCPRFNNGCRSKLCSGNSSKKPTESIAACSNVQVQGFGNSSDSTGHREYLQGVALKVPSIKSFEWGTNNSPEGFNEGLTHCFVVSFDDEKGRQAYWDNPAHNDFVNNHLKPYMEKVVVIDYFVNK